MNDWAQTLTIIISVIGGFWAITKTMIEGINYLQTIKEATDIRFNGLETRQKDMGQRIGDFTKDFHRLDKAYENLKNQHEQSQETNNSLISSAKYKFRDFNNRLSIVEKYLEKKGARIIPGEIIQDEDVDLTDKSTFS